MSNVNQRDPGKERFWRRTLNQWRRSGLSIRDFCRWQGLSESSFYFWRRTLDERDRQQLRDQTPRFVPLQVLPELEPEPAVSPTEPATSGLELLLDNGRVLRVGNTFDAATLRRLLALLEEDRP
jgi:transposase-like protein